MREPLSRAGAERRELVPERPGLELRASETRILETVGAFRIVPEGDLAEGRTASGQLRQDLRHLETEGLIERHRLVVDERPTSVVALTKAGKALLEDQRTSVTGRSQAYYAGVVKPRELAHDALLYRVFRAEADRIEGEGGRVRRIVLDYELKREYQSFLNRRDKRTDATLDEDRQAFAREHTLPIVDGHLELPDLRLEYEGPDGALSYRDVELVTEHYSRAQLAGKTAAGFSLYRSGGHRGSQTGGSPQDPRHLEWLK